MVGMKIAYLGAGTWGFALTSILSQNGHQVKVWTREKSFADLLQKSRVHPKLSGFTMPDNVEFTSDLEYTLEDAEVIVESVTSSGLRTVFEKIGNINIPIILTSKGIEQGTGFLLPEVISDVMGMAQCTYVGVLSGPSHAEEVIENKPTSVVCSAYDPKVTKLICELFTTPTFRIYPNEDIHGVCFGGAMKNIIAIACGISDGLTDSANAKAALMTRGLHEIRKLCVVKNAKPETLNGLSGMGDLCVTCMSTLSRNYRFGKYLAEGDSPQHARERVGMAVEGIYSCVSAYELGEKYHIPIPVTEATYSIIFKGLDPKIAVKALLTRAIKDEHL